MWFLFYRVSGYFIESGKKRLIQKNWVSNLSEFWIIYHKLHHFQAGCMLVIRTLSELNSLANNAKIKSSLYILIRYHFEYFVECLRAIRDNYQEKINTQIFLGGCQKVYFIQGYNSKLNQNSRKYWKSLW